MSRQRTGIQTATRWRCSNISPTNWWWADVKVFSILSLHELFFLLDTPSHFMCDKTRYEEDINDNQLSVILLYELQWSSTWHCCEDDTCGSRISSIPENFFGPLNKGLVFSNYLVNITCHAQPKRASLPAPRSLSCPSRVSRSGIKEITEITLESTLENTSECTHILIKIMPVNCVI